MRTVSLARESAYNSKIRTFKVYCDGKRIADIKDGQTISFPVSESAHELEVRMSWMSSNTLEIEPGDALIGLQCKIVGGVWSVLWNPKNWIKLERIE